MTARVIADDGHGDSSTRTLDAFKVPRIPHKLTLDEAAALWAEIDASEALPGHVKDALGQRLNARLDEVSGRARPTPAATMAGVWFHAALPDEVDAGRKALDKAMRPR